MFISGNAPCRIWSNRVIQYLHAAIGAGIYYEDKMDKHAPVKGSMGILKEEREICRNA